MKRSNSLLRLLGAALLAVGIWGMMDAVDKQRASNAATAAALADLELRVSNLERILVLDAELASLRARLEELEK